MVAATVQTRLFSSRRAMRRSERVLEVLATLGHPAGTERGLGDYLDRVAAACCGALDYRACLIYLYDRHDETFYADATHGIGPEEREALLAAPVPVRVAEQLMSETYRLDWSYYVPVSAPVWNNPEVADCFTMSATPASINQAGWQPGDLFLIPLEIDGREPIGFIVLDEPLDGSIPDAPTLLGIATLAKSCANAVESAHLYKTQTEEAAISSALLQVSEAAGTTDQTLLFTRASSTLATLLGADHCAVWYDDDEGTAFHLVIDALSWAARRDEPLHAWDGEGGLRRLLARGEPVWVEQPQSGGGASGNAAALIGRLGLTSALLIPLSLRDTLAGAIVAGWVGPPHQFRQRELDIARGVSRLVGVALQNARLHRDTTRQAERNAALYEREREAVQRLQELDQLRNDFVSTVSHELRTPLTGIKGFADTLITYWERMNDERRVEMVRKINASANRLERLVKDLLFISRVESGSLPLQRVMTALEPIIDGAVQEIKAKYRGQEIQVRAPLERLTVLADTDRVQQIVANLLDNAAKYSPEGRPIRIRWARQGETVRIAVADCGRGIEQADFERLFTRFGKLSSAPRAGHVGTGLGLYISKSLIENMGGQITVHSRPGRGSVFAFTLPLANG